MKRQIPFTTLQDINKKSLGREIVLFGSGIIAEKTARILSDKKIVAIVDNASNLWGQKQLAVEIRSPQYLQKEGKNNIKTANNSNLPSNIPNESIHLETSGIDLKFPFGPITSPSPGPTFDIDVAAPEIADKKSRPVIESNMDIKININKYAKTKTITEFI